MSDVSQPDLCMEIHNLEDTAEERYRRYLFSERDDLNRTELRCGHSTPFLVRANAISHKHNAMAL